MRRPFVLTTTIALFSAAVFFVPTTMGAALRVAPVQSKLQMSQDQNCDAYFRCVATCPFDTIENYEACAQACSDLNPCTIDP